MLIAQIGHLEPHKIHDGTPWSRGTRGVLLDLLSLRHGSCPSRESFGLGLGI